MFFVLGNGDAHLKNFSLIRTETAGYHLSPVYDIVNSRLALPYEHEEMCLSIQGKKNKLNRQDFTALAMHSGLNEKQMDNVFKRLADAGQVIEKQIKQSFLTLAMRKQFIGIFRERMKRVL